MALAVFKTVVAEDLGQAGSIPVRLRQALRPAKPAGSASAATCADPHVLHRCAKYSSIVVSPSAPLIGRDDELQRLSDALERCTAGTGGVVLVSGEAGIGKTRLVSDVLQRWAGQRVATTATAGSAAYAPVADVLRALAAEGRAASLPPAWEQDALRAVATVLHAVAQQEPTVLLLEDLHLADAATVDLLPGLAEKLEHDAVLLLATYRSDVGARTSHPCDAHGATPSAPARRHFAAPARAG